MFNLEEIKIKLKNFFSQKEEIKFAYLFGSVAKRLPTKLSDIDLAIFVNEKMIKRKKYPFGYKASLFTELVSELHTNEIDLVLLNEALPLLAHRVIRDGILLDCKDESARINFQVCVIQQYIDTEKIRQVKEKYLKERIYSGKFGKI